MALVKLKIKISGFLVSPVVWYRPKRHSKFEVGVRIVSSRSGRIALQLVELVEFRIGGVPACGWRAEHGAKLPSVSVARIADPVGVICFQPVVGWRP